MVVETVCTILSSWHVGTKENVLRVKRDEAEARAREEEKEKRALLAVGLLRGQYGVERPCVQRFLERALHLKFRGAYFRQHIYLCIP